jgi:IS30 family transposase
VEVRTITSDNGKEFTMHESLAEKINCDWYFANPYHSWEKGSVENDIKCIRKYLPKGTDLTKISNNYVKIIEDKLNNTPRKILGYKTPNEVFFNNFTFVALVA